MWTSRWWKERSSSEEDLKKIRMVRAHTKILVSLGDCAVTGNVPSMRKHFGANACCIASTSRTPRSNAQIPREVIPQLLKHCGRCTRS